MPAGRVGFKLSSVHPVAKRADESAGLGAVEHNGRGRAVPKGAQPDERGLSGGAYVRAVLVGVDDERRAELRGERGEGAARLRALLERARVVAEEDVDLAAAGNALHSVPLARDNPEPVTTGPPRRPDGERAAVGEAAQPAETEACSGRQVVQPEAERDRAGRGRAGAGVGERVGIVVVSVHEQKLETRPPEQFGGRPKEAAPFRVARQVAEVSEGDEGVAAFIDGSLDQATQLTSVAVQVSEDEQPAHSSRGYRLRPAHGRTGIS